MVSVTDHSALKRLIEYAAAEAEASDLAATADMLRLAAASLDMINTPAAAQHAASSRPFQDLTTPRAAAALHLFRKEKLQ